MVQLQYGHTPEPVIRKSREAERMPGEGKTIPEVPRHLEISELEAPIDPATYDYEGAVLWNWHAPALWNRFTIELVHVLAAEAGLSERAWRERVRLAFVKVAEFQARGLVHYHAVIRLDGAADRATAPGRQVSPTERREVLKQGQPRADHQSPQRPRAEERGSCYVELHRPQLAEIALNEALRHSLSMRRRGSVFADLAMIGAQCQDPDRILAYASTALDTARQTGSGFISRKLQDLQTYLTPFLSDSRIRQLNTEITDQVSASITQDR